MTIHVIDETRRCLQCKYPRCVKGCPVDTDIPKIIELFRTQQKKKAGQILFKNNPLSIICSLICNHEAQCEGNCVLGYKSAPVHISSIEHYISDAYLDQLKLSSLKNKDQRVAIIGSGPAGLTIAIVLAQRGYKVTIFESRQKIGGVMRYGIPEFRLPKIILDKFQNQLLAAGIKIRPNTTIGRTLTVDDLQRDGYEAIFIGTGAWKAKAMKIPGESLGHVNYAVDYLVNPDVYNLGDSLVIIGAGNAAMDVARTAIRKGVKHVNVFCRRNTLAASAREADYARADGVEFFFCMRPTKITDDGIFFRKVELDEDENIIHTSEEQFFSTSSIIIAISQGAQNSIATSTTGLEMNENGLLQADECGRTTRDGIFAAGDVVLGARSVVEAVKYSKLVAEEIDVYLQGKNHQ